MGLRGRVLSLLAALLAAGLLGLTWVATGLLYQSAEEAMQLGITPPAAAARLGEIVGAAESLLWLAAGALLAVGVGVGAIFLRGPLMGPLDRLGRRLDRGEKTPGLAPEAPLAERIERTLAHQRQQLHKQRQINDGHLQVVQAYGEAVDRARAELVAADRLAMTGQLALGATHELGGSLAIAITCLDTLALRREIALPKSQDPKNDLLVQAIKALETVDAIAAELSAFGHPRRLQAEGADALATLDKARHLARLHRRCRRLQFDLKAPPPLSGLRVTLSARHLQQIALNLMVNAADAGADHVQFTLRAASTHLEVTVQDDGPGIPEALRREIFKPFFTTKPPEEGSGLGLAVSRRLLSEVGGELKLCPTQDAAGACFHLHLPLETPVNPTDRVPTNGSSTHAKP